jgi:hypothetical protein
MLAPILYSPTPGLILLIFLSLKRFVDYYIITAIVFLDYPNIDGIL